MRYYSTERPLGLGTHPKCNAATVENFDDKTFCEDIGREAWGYIDFPDDFVISEDDLRTYSLIPAGMKKWWCVTSAYFDDGRVIAAITDSTEAMEKPESSSVSLKRKDVYVDWLPSHEEAVKFVQDSLKA